uniref:Uridine phosphorylase 2 n=1 Tax=Accipiter nisus TaxID=211598 RepID=A0A8B9NGK2_9AVES
TASVGPATAPAPGRNLCSGLIHIKNPHLDSMEENVLYHLDLGTKTHNLSAMFGDIKLICVGSSPNRTRAFAQFTHKQLGLTGKTGRTCITGNDTFLSSQQHGMGIPSISIVLQEELIKLLHQAKCRDVTIIRICTSGGLGNKLLVTGLADSFQPRFELVVLGDVVVRSTGLDKDCVGELLACSKEIPDLPTLVGHTMRTYDFHKGRLDGALCSFSSEKKLEYLKRAYDTGMRNIETEPSAFVALSCGLKGESSRGRFHVLSAPPCSPVSPCLRVRFGARFRQPEGQKRIPNDFN